jgi:hypothetical protein
MEGPNGHDVRRLPRLQPAPGHRFENTVSAPRHVKDPSSWDVTEIDLIRMATSQNDIKLKRRAVLPSEGPSGYPVACMTASGMYATKATYATKVCRRPLRQLLWH